MKEGILKIIYLLFILAILFAFIVLLIYGYCLIIIFIAMKVFLINFVCFGKMFIMCANFVTDCLLLCLGFVCLLLCGLYFKCFFLHHLKFLLILWNLLYCRVII